MSPTGRQLRVLVLVKHFPPWRTEPNTARLLKYLARHGARVEVLHGEPGWGAAADVLTRDDDLAAQLPPKLQRHPIRLANPLRGLKQLLRGREGGGEVGTRRASVSFLGRLYRSLLFIPDADYYWIGPAVRHGLRLLREWRPDLLVTSGPPFSTHLAGWFLKLLTGVPWAGHFRDAYTGNPLYIAWTRWRAGFDHALERHVVGSMDLVTTVYPEETAKYRRRCARPGQLYATVRNGYDEEIFLQAATGVGRPEDDRVTFLHGGKLVADDVDGRTAHRLLDALARLLTRRPELRRKLRFRFVGVVHPIYHEVAARLELEEVLTIEAPVSNREMIARTLAADVNLIILEDSPKNMTTTGGKIYECLRAGKPILGILHPRSSPARLLRRLNAGRVADYSNTEEIEHELEKLYDEVSSGGCDYGGPERDEFVRRTSFENLAVRYTDYLRSVLD